MNPLAIVSYIKYGIGILLVTAVGLVVWNIKSTYTENSQLKKSAEIANASIVTLHDDIKLQKDVNDALLLRKNQVDIVYKDRVIYTTNVKNADTSYIEKTKKEIETIKTKSPETLDQFYYLKYNVILTCIEQTTMNGDKLCDMH